PGSAPPGRRWRSSPRARSPRSWPAPAGPAAATSRCPGRRGGCTRRGPGACGWRPRPRPGPRAGYGRRGTTCAGRRPERGVRKTWGTAYPRGGPPFSRNTLPGHLPDERPERGAPGLAAPADVSEDGRMPELPEVAALADFLRERTSGHTVRSVEVGSIAALKTFSPSPDALAGGTVADVARHGKWLDVAVATS